MSTSSAARKSLRVFQPSVDSNLDRALEEGPVNLTRHRVGGVEIDVISWSAEEFARLDPLDQAIVGRSGALLAGNGARHLAIKAS